MTPDTIDITDESLMRWHYTNFAEDLGLTRREAELAFRDDWDKLRKLKSDNRDHVFTVMLRLVNALV